MQVLYKILVERATKVSLDFKWLFNRTRFIPGIYEIRFDNHQLYYEKGIQDMVKCSNGAMRADLYLPDEEDDGTIRNRHV